MVEQWQSNADTVVKLFLLPSFLRPIMRLLTRLPLQSCKETRDGFAYVRAVGAAVPHATYHDDSAQADPPV